MKKHNNILNILVSIILALIFSIFLLAEQSLMFNQNVEAGIFSSNKTEDIEDNSEVKQLDDGTIEIIKDDENWLLPEIFFETENKSQQDITFPDFSEIQASQYIVMDLDSNEILLEKGMNEIAYPASMTKVLTALTVIESPDFDLEKPVIFSEYAVDMPSPVSVTAGFSAGEETSTKNALSLMLVKSANDCARALAENYGGTEEDFVVLMNAKAQEIGCTNTNMTESAGFGLEDHHFSPYDLALIIQRAMQHDIFNEIVSTKTYFAEPTSYNGTTGWQVASNSNLLLTVGDNSLKSTYLHTYDGVKTGTTDLAGYCLAAAVHTYDGRHLCGIIFNGDIQLASGQTRIEILLRGILEKAAIDADCPDEQDTLVFLQDNPGIIEKIQMLKKSEINQIVQIENSENNTDNEEVESKIIENKNGSSKSDNDKKNVIQNDKINSEKTEGRKLLAAENILFFIALLLLLIIIIALSRKLFKSNHHKKRR